MTEQLFHHVWHGGLDATDPARLAELQGRLQNHMAQRDKPWNTPDSDVVKQRLRANSDEALALGLFGVPAMVVEGRVFWGFDALPMLRAYLDGDAWFDAQWEATADRPQGARRPQA
ncbi:DSBA-like thioredoxin domain protein [compost metagenome]